MRIYQPKKNNPYLLPNSVYQWIIYIVRDIGKYNSGFYDRFPSFAPSRRTVEAVNTAVNELPEEYRQIIYNNVAFEEVLPDGYRNKTTTLIKARFIYQIAVLLNYPFSPDIIASTNGLN